MACACLASFKDCESGIEFHGENFLLVDPALGGVACKIEAGLHGVDGVDDGVGGKVEDVVVTCEAFEGFGGGILIE